MNKGKPNILLIVADDLGCCDLGCMGNDYVKTPSIDSLAHDGMMLTQHYSASPMCAPARAALQTGKYPHRVGTLDVACHRGYDRISDDEVLISQILKENGYTTGLIGKWHNGSGPKQFHPCKRGYDEFIGYRSGSIDYFDWELEYTYSQPYLRQGNTYITDVFTDEAEKFIRRHKENKFFLQLAYSAPHRPLQAPIDDINEFENCKGITRGMATLYAMIKRMDAGIGKILKVLKELGLEDNTIVLFVSDNGPDFVSENGLSPLRDSGFNGHKGDVLEGGIRVPGIIRWPKKIKPCTKSNSPIHFVDWMPTLLSFLGINIGKVPDIDGNDVSNIFLNNKDIERDAMYWQWSRYQPVEKCNSSVRMGKWKLYYPPVQNSLKVCVNEIEYSKKVYRKTFKILKEPHIRNLGKCKEAQLYNLEMDPKEQNNIAAKYPSIVKQMSDMLNGWYGKVTKEWKEASKRTLVDE